ncbi:50S ribosomal protein L11 methyltransferase [Dehalobacterium formicoaceticum]|uniref:Ribosomal protein L11 methyltransferase n=1 Tax=Dehalobacterium formicoaceticum TaxID=51515 RepID=A0ABT1Y240_9FIRM|nr:50S ribosomal protein L11 methyltransferase [Dehalobacterium formicoaceticum]MCR6544942.1 50S ribosomal protein L11 methyltransferase [Dehalobacterium formicoaceticum]
MNYLEVTVTTTEEMSESLANLFWELGAGGVVIEEPFAMRRNIDDQSWDAWEISPELLDAENVIIKGYFPIDHRLVETMAAFKKQSEEIRSLFPEGRLQITETEVATEDWATSWKAYYKPERIGNRVVIKPSWESYQAKEGEIIIEMDPGMAFGTGNHPTTAMCIRALEEYVFPGCRVIDVGSGSGILALTAAKLGAGKVLAIDHDPVSIDATRDNITLNGANARVSVVQGDLASGIKGTADIIVANIIADVIIRLIPQTLALLEKNGIFIASGIIKERLLDVETVLKEHAFLIEKVMHEGEWVVVIARRG